MRKRLSGSLSAKLLAGQLLVVLTGALTLLLVALLVGPAIFRMHVRDALGYVPPDVGHHLDMAFHVATLISLGVAVGASVAVALALSSIVSTRIVRPVRELAGAAQRIAHGSRDARVPARGTDELAELAGAFNEMAASLEHAEQIRSQLLADVAHELRTPLATVESYVEALADGVLAADDENWGVIRSETSRLNRLVDDLQKVSRAQAHQLDLHLAPVAAAALVTDAVKAAEPSYTSKGVGLEADIEPSVPAIEADSERIAEVLANLLTNALRHTPSGASSRSPRVNEPNSSRSPSPTTARESHPSTSTVSSSASTGSTRHARGPAAAPASASRSSGRSSKPTAAPSPPPAPASDPEHVTLLLPIHTQSAVDARRPTDARHRAERFGPLLSAGGVLSRAASSARPRPPFPQGGCSSRGTR